MACWFASVGNPSHKGSRKNWSQLFAHYATPCRRRASFLHHAGGRARVRPFLGKKNLQPTRTTTAADVSISSKKIDRKLHNDYTSKVSWIMPAMQTFVTPSKHVPLRCKAHPEMEIPQKTLLLVFAQSVALFVPLETIEVFLWESFYIAVSVVN